MLQKPRGLASQIQYDAMIENNKCIGTILLHF